MSSSTNSRNGEKLRFRDPNSRDIVLSMHNNARSSPAQAIFQPKSQDNNNQENPVLTKIKNMLAQSNPEKWERFGEALRISNKYPKSYDSWEIVYCIDIQTGLLVFRKSQAVTSQYFGGGYTLTPTASENYFIELRARAWDPRTLIDPYFRSSLDKDKQLKVLGDGEVARHIFMEVESIVNSFSGEKHREIVQVIDNLSREILERAKTSDSSSWVKSEQEVGTVSYSSEIDGVVVVITKSTKNNLSNYRLIFTRDKISSRIADVGLSKDLFELIDEKNKTAALEALSSVLEGAGF